jgi:hypothetical protein
MPVTDSCFSSQLCPPLPPPVCRVTREAEEDWSRNERAQQEKPPLRGGGGGEDQDLARVNTSFVSQAAVTLVPVL